MRPLALGICLVLMTGCAGSTTAPTSPLNTEFTLAPGESIAIENAPLVVRFNSVSGDSRCPADAICIQGGSAAVRITAVSNRSSGDYELHTGDMSPVQHDGFVVGLVQLAPYPFGSRTIAPEEYRATLRVTR